MNTKRILIETPFRLGNEAISHWRWLLSSRIPIVAVDSHV